MMDFQGHLTTIALGLAWSRVHLLGSLKEQLDKFEKQNAKFKESNDKLKQHVNDLRVENVKLEAANKRLENSIHGLEDVQAALEQFASQAHEGFDQVLSSLKGSIEEQKRIQ